jgi:predicted  nucleic acid-binding Zn-ribbon protein
MAKKAKGKRPIYLDDAHSDKLLAMVMALVGEVSVLHERLDTLERLTQAKGILSMEEIEAYQPDEQVAQEREQWRREYIARVLRVVQEEVDSLR